MRVLHIRDLKQEGCTNDCMLNSADKAVFTLGAQALVPGHQRKIVLRSDTDTPNTQVPFSARVKGQDLAPGHGHCA